MEDRRVERVMNRGLENLFSWEKTQMLASEARGFLAAMGTPALMGEKWEGIFNVLPENRFDRLLAACGFNGDAQGFFAAVRHRILECASQGESAEIRFGDIELPLMFLYHLLETDDSGQSLQTIKKTKGLEQAVGFPVEAPAILQQVLDQYPVRLSRHVIRQSLVSGAVAAQYLPFADELDPEGHTMTFEGHFKQGLMEQMYQNRAIFLLDMRCPVYCRFCFRKHKSLRREKSPDRQDVEQALARVRENRDIKEILITGGEPLINLRNLDTAMEGLLEIDHVKTMRIATRSLAYYPHLFLHHDKSLISRLRDWQRGCRKKGKRIEVGVHMVHSDEVSVQTLDIISQLTASGIPVYVQTPFLKGLNDTGEALGRLFTLLRHAGAEIYYIFTPCHPIHGTQKYWSPISLSMEAFAHLRANISDRAIPKLCTATPLGKMEWHTSGWAVEPDENELDHIWIRTPYTREYFKDMAEAALPDVRENRDGTLDVKCLIDMGNSKFFMGTHDLPPVAGNRPATPKDLKEIQALFYQSHDLMDTRYEAPCPGMRRVHKTRVETDLPCPGPVMDSLGGHPEITDILLRVPGYGGEEGIDGQIESISGFVRDLDRFGDRPFCIRIRWQAYRETPWAFDPAHIDEIANMARLSFARPRRVEIETWWLSPEQVTQAHCELSHSLLSRGIPVYGNMALMPGINDEPVLVAKMAHALREGAVDFHHVYVSGLSVQKQITGANAVTTDRVLSIASHVRKVCSGREIPLYLAWTPGGDADFGLNLDFSF